jgi:hypothetical protein
VTAIPARFAAHRGAPADASPPGDDRL